MATGDLTLTNKGSYDISGAALKTVVDSLNSGAATAGADTTSLYLIPTANGQQVQVITVARAA